MKKKLKAVLCIVLTVIMTVSLMGSAFAADAGSPGMKVGVAKVDITGPIIDISTGYNSLGDLMEGLNTRLYARAFVVDDGNAPMVYVSAEIVHMTESIKPGVLKLLSAHGYTCFSEENVMLSATHCHSSTSNVAWVALYDLMNGVPGYDDESYELIVKGIAEAIEQAYDSRVRGSVSLVYGETDIDASNRSADAYLTNKNVADYGYDIGDDGSFSYETGLQAAQNAYNHEMSGIVLTDSRGKDLGFLNFFGSHGTSNPITNKLVASDHKGYAALKVEEKMGDGFVAAFAQADSGDTSPNAVQESDYHDAFLRPADMDASLDLIENQIVQGTQEANAALSLIACAKRIPLTGKFDFNYSAVDFSDITVELSYVGDYYMPYDDLSAGYVKTSEPCIGAGIIAGDEEGAPVDNALEGAVKHNFVWNEETRSYDRIPCDFTMIDLSGLEVLFEPLWPYAMKLLGSDGYDDAQMEKVVCLAVGDLMQPTQPLQILRMGQLAIVGVPFEFTYEQANRTKAVLEKTLAADGITKVIVSTHTNAYSQYVTTREEYAAQHYEGATCLFGPWSGAALTQELDKLAQGLVSGVKSDVRDPMLQEAPCTLIYTPFCIVDPIADLGEYGTVITDVDKDVYTRGEWVRASFTGVSPRHITNLRLADSELVDGYSYMEVQKQVGSDWVTVLTDTDPYTTFRCVKDEITDLSFDVTVGWLLKGGNWTPGTYRLVYNGIAKVELFTSIKEGEYKCFSVASSPFCVEDPDYAPGSDNPFLDVKAGSVYYDAVLWAYYHEPRQIAAGVTPLLFAPEADCTRAQVVTFLWRAAGCPEPQGECPFTDLAEDSPYYDAVTWAYENGIAAGVSAASFAPNAPVTRAQFVTFLWRYEGCPETVGTVDGFTDADSIAAPYRTAVAWAVEKGVTVGYDDGSFRPDTVCPRWAVLCFMYRALA